MDDEMFRQEVCGSLIRIEALLERLVSNKTYKPVVRRAPAVEFPPEFEAFWSEYPEHRRKDKLNALLEWKRSVTPDMAGMLMSALSEHKQREDWTKNDGQYVPSIKNWIRDQRWLDAKKKEGWNGLGKYGKLGETI